MSDPQFTCPHSAGPCGEGCEPAVAATASSEHTAIALDPAPVLQAGPLPSQEGATEGFGSPGTASCGKEAASLQPWSDEGLGPSSLPGALHECAFARQSNQNMPDEDVPDTGSRSGFPGFDWEDGDASLPLLAGVRLSRSGPMCFFEVGSGLQQELRGLREQGRRLMPGEKLMVETESGAALGELAVLRHMDPACLGEGAGGCRGEVLGFAKPEDVDLAEKNRFLASEARTYCQECIRQRSLDMKLVDVEVTHDRSKIAFYFTAPSRIDFRELVKDLVRKYRTRIELRQIGVRHETQMLGAVGNCGMVCCCRRYLRNFVSVAIKMAKEQNIFLNPAKISGICGRLLCCLAYEQENYDEFYRRCPKLGKKYLTSKGPMRVLRANMFRETISVLSEANEELELSLEEWKDLEPRRNEASLPGGQFVPQAGQAQTRRDNGRAEREQGRPEAGREGPRDRRRPDRSGQAPGADGRGHAPEAPRPDRRERGSRAESFDRPGAGDRQERAFPGRSERRERPGPASSSERSERAARGERAHPRRQTASESAFPHDDLFAAADLLACPTPSSGGPSSSGGETDGGKSGISEAAETSGSRFPPCDEDWQDGGDSIFGLAPVRRQPGPGDESRPGVRRPRPGGRPKSRGGRR